MQGIVGKECKQQLEYKHLKLSVCVWSFKYNLFTWCNAEFSTSVSNDPWEICFFWNLL